MLLHANRRRAVTAVECAIIYPVLILLLLGLLVGGFGVFRYQQVASLAREGARYASTHGTKHSQATAQPAATAAEVYNTAILPKVVGMDPSKVSYSVTWSPDNKPGSIVTCTVTYQWMPEAFLGGIQLSSTSKMMMSW